MTDIRYGTARIERICLLQAVFSKSMTVSEAAQHFNVPRGTIYTWRERERLSAMISSTMTKNSKRIQMPETPPLPKGLKLRDAIMAYATCNYLGLDSEQTGAYCRAHGILVSELKTFGQWFETAGAVVMDKTLKALERHNETLLKEKREQEKELNRKEKALTESAALLVLSNKPGRFGGTRETDQRPGSSQCH